MADYQPMTLEQRIAALQAENGKLIDSNNALTQTVIGKMGEINHALSDAQQDISEAITLAGSKTDQAILNFADSHSDIKVSYYDQVAHSKASLGVVADPEDESCSEWVLVPTTSIGYHIYPTVGALTKIHLVNGYSYSPGYSETPQYERDWSVTYMQFVFANSAATSAEINEQLNANSVSVRNFGGWWNGASTGSIPVLKFSQHHPYSRLFVRFINRTYAPAATSKPPQNIVEFGGNATFAVDRVINYPRIEM
ncbi:hypothetical protein QDG88_12525 [Pseudoalteromonas piscicida]|uniref:hypothetical protein n=1 Tax=Pseudoalteromonas piscicida TaxID=43662 RepID=UPI002739BB53|nr:hypothetical protein [Pseudoalteromonas piscicida]MDP4488751.1 hypothetical protein [Pseudoalteromonas piscicida]